MDKKILFLDDNESRLNEELSKLNDEIESVNFISKVEVNEIENLYSDHECLIMHDSEEGGDIINSAKEKLYNKFYIHEKFIARFSGSKRNYVIKADEISEEILETMLSRNSAYGNIPEFSKYFKNSEKIEPRILLYGKDFIKVEALMLREKILINRIEEKIFSKTDEENLKRLLSISGLQENQFDSIIKKLNKLDYEQLKSKLANLIITYILL